MNYKKKKSIKKKKKKEIKFNLYPYYLIFQVLFQDRL